MELTGVLPERQRLLFAGHALQDDQRLRERGVRDGHTIHLVERAEGATAGPPPPPPGGMAPVIPVKPCHTRTHTIMSACGYAHDTSMLTCTRCRFCNAGAASVWCEHPIQLDHPGAKPTQACRSVLVLSCCSHCPFDCLPSRHTAAGWPRRPWRCCSGQHPAAWHPRWGHAWGWAVHRPAGDGRAAAPGST